MSTTWPEILGLGNIYTAMAYLGVPSVTSTTLALDSAYTYGSAGDALMAMAFTAPETANLTDIWLYVVSYTGTWGNTDGVINWQIREGLNGTRIPGTTLTASGTFALDGATTGWHRITGLTAALTAGKMYCLVLADADGGASDYVTIQVRWGTGPVRVNPLATEIGTSTNGFGTAYSAITATFAGAIKIGTRTIAGQIFGAMNTVTSGTYERGCRFKPEEDCVFIGWGAATDNSILVAGHALKLYADATAPGGSTLAILNPGATPMGGGTTPSPFAAILPAASFVDLDADTWYRAVIDPASAIAIPRKATYPGSPDATLLAAAMPMGGECYWTIEDTGAWADDPTAMSHFGPILVPRTASATGGGGLLTHPGWSGGMRG